MTNQTSTPMSVKPSQASAMSVGGATKAQHMSRHGSLAPNDEPSKASEALVEVLSATLNHAAAPSFNRGINATAAAAAAAPSIPGKVETSHSLAHTAGAPVAVVTSESENQPRPMIGLGHAMPNTDMSRGASRQSHNGPAGSIKGLNVDPSPLIVHHLRQLISEEISRADSSLGYDSTSTEGNHANRGLEVPRAPSAMTNYQSARVSMDSRSTMTVSGHAAPNDKDVGEPALLFKESELPPLPLMEVPTRMGPMTPSQSHLPLEEKKTFPNPWAKARYHMREPLAEALGTFILMIFGNGINAQVSLSTLINPASPKGDFLSVSFGWGIGVAMGVYVAGGVSGGHINPAVTISFAVFRGFPWRKVPLYILGQSLGAFLGALVIYGVYSNPLHTVDPNQTELTAAIFATYPVDYLRTSTTRISCFLNESVGSMILLLVIMALGDSNNTPPVDGMAPLALLWLVVGIGACLGWQTSYAINPARDLGPRLMLWAVGYTPDVLWNFDAFYFLWGPILATIVGGLVGCFLYDAVCYTGAESPLNAEWKFPGRSSNSSSPFWRGRRQAQAQVDAEGKP
ncbi:hypothetical protein A4X13_0g2221 [Tilletia indica]|uniref:Uncharacterized protein n=1 Tax=Tilletia indica TaxID=43049 RepID=A0A177TQX9_9BASI|nr:hypothetical protein A4X13_0g2221 [Tilletia indica]